MDNRGKKAGFSALETFLSATFLFVGSSGGALGNPSLSIADSSDLINQSAVFFHLDSESAAIKAVQAVQSDNAAPAAKAAEDPLLESLPAEKPAETAEEKIAEKSAEPSEEKTAEKPAEPAAEKPAETTPRMIDLVVPNVEPTVVTTRKFPIPFAVPQTDPSRPAKEIELIYSDSAGKTWESYERIQVDKRASEFMFQAPSDGEYWFALRTFFGDGAETVTKVQKIRVETSSPAAAAVSRESMPSDKIDNAKTTPAPFPSASLPLLSGAAGKEKQGSAVPSATSEKGKNSDSTIVQGLLLLAGDGSAKSSNASTPDGVQPIDLSAVEQKEGAASGDVPEEEIIRPGKIKEIKLGRSPVGSLAVSIRWFRPDELGLIANPKNKVRVERADSPEGPWSAISDDWETSRSGFWFNATPEYAAPFYLRTVSVDETGKESIDRIPTPIDLSSQLKQYGVVPADDSSEKIAKTASGENSTERSADSSTAKNGFANVSLEKESKPDTPIEAWAPEPSGERKKELVAALAEEKSPIINKTASVSQSPEIPQAPARQNNQAAGNPENNPGQLRLNPLFTRGFGVFSRSASSARVDSGMPGMPNADAASSPYDAALSKGPAQASAPAKRSIFTPSPAYRYRDPQAAPPEAPAANRPAQSGAYDAVNSMNMNGESMIYNVNGQPFSGNMNGMMNGMEQTPDIIYEDANGNRISNPFINGGSASQEMILPGANGGMYGGEYTPGQTLNGGQSAMYGGEYASGQTLDGGQSAMYGGEYASGQTLDGGQSGVYGGDVYGGGMIMPNNTGEYYPSDQSMAPTSNNYFNYQSPQNGPYSGQEQILGAQANLPGPAPQSVSPSALPPKPTTR